MNGAHCKRSHKALRAASHLISLRRTPIIEPTGTLAAQPSCTEVEEIEKMPWYAWLILFIALGSIVGGLMLLRDTAKKLPLTEEQLKKIHVRNAEMDAKEQRDR